MSLDRMESWEWKIKCREDLGKCKIFIVKYKYLFLIWILLLNIIVIDDINLLVVTSEV